MIDSTSKSNQIANKDKEGVDSNAKTIGTSNILDGLNTQNN